MSSYASLYIPLLPLTWSTRLAPKQVMPVPLKASVTLSPFTRDERYVDRK